MSEKRQQRTILDLGHEKAREFFLCHESYTNMDLPRYFNFSRLLQAIDNLFQKHSFQLSKAGEVEEVNYSMLFNKDGRYGWRRVELIHPVLYVALVRMMTEKKHWAHIQGRFAAFRKHENVVECMSVPVERPPKNKQKLKALTIQNWWNRTEQQSIGLALKYGRVLHTDITDCYGSIYTHSIDWAMHGKEEAKRSKDKHRIGARIDKAIRDMRHRQSNGIPQGSVLMDFIAEMVLGYADTLIGDAIKDERIGGVQVIRYRDDYRIFAGDESKSDKVMKIIAKIAMGLGMRINSSKTKTSREVIRSSIKPDKLAWLERAWLEKQQEGISLQKRLLLIHEHAYQHPNAGSLLRALKEFYEMLLSAERMPYDVLPMISIAVDIASRNPRTYPHVSAVISALLGFISDAKERAVVCEQIVCKFRKAPNSGHMETWLQRIVCHHIRPNLDESLTQIKALGGDISSIWNNGWINSERLKNLLENSNLIIDKDIMEKMGPVVGMDEIDLFRDMYY